MKVPKRGMQAKAEWAKETGDEFSALRWEQVPDSAGRREQRAASQQED